MIYFYTWKSNQKLYENSVCANQDIGKTWSDLKLVLQADILNNHIKHLFFYCIKSI